MHQPLLCLVVPIQERELKRQKLKEDSTDGEISMGAAVPAAAIEKKEEKVIPKVVIDDQLSALKNGWHCPTGMNPNNIKVASHGLVNITHEFNYHQ